MSQPKIQQNQIPNEPQMKDLLDLFKKDIFLSMNVHHLATIQSFNASNQTASATINYKKTFFQLNSETGLYDPVLLDYPQLIDCPVICLGGSSTALTFPIVQGDECLVFFNDRDMDNWFAGNSNGAVASSRLHSFSDGIILVGVRSLSRKISSYDTSHAVLRNNAGAAVGVNKTTALALIQGSSGTLGTALQAFCSACSGSSDATLVAAAAALSTALGGILE